MASALWFRDPRALPPTCFRPPLSLRDADFESGSVREVTVVSDKTIGKLRGVRVRKRGETTSEPCNGWFLEKVRRALQTRPLPPHHQGSLAPRCHTRCTCHEWKRAVACVKGGAAAAAIQARERA